MSLGDIQEGRNEDADFSCTSYRDQEAALESTEETKLATNETKAVACLRFGLAAVLLTATVLSAIGIYIFSSGLEQDEFEEAFDDNSAKLLEAFQVVADRRLGTIAAFGASVTAHTIATNSTWPFVSIPSFAAQGEHVLKLASAPSLTLVMVVEPEDRPKWENEFIPQAAPKWVAEELLYANQTSQGSGRSGGPPPADEENYEGKPTKSKDGFYEQIYTNQITSLGTRDNVIAKNETNLVWWQNTPFNPIFSPLRINKNVRYDESFEGEVLNVLLERKVALGRTTTSSYGSRGMPVTGLYYPLLTAFGDDAKVGGALASLMNWEVYFEGVLPQNAIGLVAVLKNTCEQAYTFVVNGPDVAFVGEGDLHDTKYNDMVRGVSFTSLINQGVEKGTFQGLPLDENGCQYSLKVYASSDMEEQYISRMPIFYTVGAVLIFVFTSLVFIVYDRLVERRQRLVEKEAQKSGAIVSSLFPGAYKERLMEEQEIQLEKKAGAKTFSSDANSKKLSNMMVGQDDDLIFVEDQIAENYSDCTVFFADISVRCFDCRSNFF